MVYIISTSSVYLTKYNPLNKIVGYVCKWQRKVNMLHYPIKLV